MQSQIFVSIGTSLPTHKCPRKKINTGESRTLDLDLFEEKGPTSYSLTKHFGPKTVCLQPGCPNPCLFFSTFLFFDPQVKTRHKVSKRQEKTDIYQMSRKYFDDIRDKRLMISSPKQWWFFCWNNPTDTQAPASLKDLLECWWQFEVGKKKNRPHIQGICYFEFPKSRTQLRDQMPAYWCLMYARPEQAIAYNQKQETRLEGPWHWTRPGRTPYMSTLTAVLNEEEPEPRPVFLLQPFIGFASRRRSNTNNH